MYRFLWVWLLLLCCLQSRAQQADVSVSVNLFQTMITNGDAAIMEVMVTNIGPDIAQGAELSLQIIQGEYSDIKLVSAENCQLDIAQGSVSCRKFGSLPSGQSRLVLVKIQLIETDSPVDLVISVESSSTTEDPNLSNNAQEAFFQINPLPTEEEFANGMLTNMPQSRRERFERTANILASLCAGKNLHSGISGTCDELFQQALLGDFETISRVLEWMQPRNSVHQARTTSELVSTQVSNVGQRITQLRAGASGFSLSGLNLKSGDQNLPIHLLSYLANSSSDSAVGDRFHSPWGFFVNGDVSMGDFSYGDEQNDGFDFDSHSITTGIDYRLNSKTVVGLALGYSEQESQAGVGSEMDVDGLSASLYALFTPSNNWFIDTRLAVADLDITQVRKESWQLIDKLFVLTALGHTSSRQFTFAINSGRNFNFGAYVFAPNFGVEYVESTVDEFLEEGAAEFNVLYFEQNFSSLQYHLGFDLSRSISLAKGVLSPQVSYSYQYLDQDEGISELALVDNISNVDFFEVGTNFLQSQSHQLSVGVSFVASQGKQFFVRYRKTFGISNFDQETINLGMRLEF